MYKANFAIADLKRHLEQGLGFAIDQLTRIGGGGALNYKAVRASDDLAFLVKCFVPERKSNCERLVANLKIMEGVKAPCRLFETTCPTTFKDLSLVCLAWRTGETSDPSRMSCRAWRTFLADYQVFAARMQQAEIVNDTGFPLKTWYGQGLGLCTGLRGYFLRPVLSALGKRDLELRPEDLRVVHGDFHTGNVLFHGEEVECFMDLENLVRKPAPADILLYCRYAYARQNKKGRARVLERFAEAVRLLPYSTREWEMAISQSFLSGFRRRTKGFTRCSLRLAWKIAQEFRLHEKFRRISLTGSVVV